MLQVAPAKVAAFPSSSAIGVNAFVRNVGDIASTHLSKLVFETARFCLHPQQHCMGSATPRFVIPSGPGGCDCF